jgi:hypothetical protein
MGEVYRAHDPKLSREVALKILLERLMVDAHRRARIEAKLDALVTGAPRERSDRLSKHPLRMARIRIDLAGVLRGRRHC